LELCATGDRQKLLLTWDTTGKRTANLFVISRSPGQPCRNTRKFLGQLTSLLGLPTMFNRQILIEQTDPELFAAIQAENARQEHHIELIASENYASPAVMAAQGTQLTNKYAEGYPGKRYYGGCVNVDVAETLAINRVKQLFGADAANVQPHCGASANQAVFLAFLKPGDTIMGMSLAEGGHLTHGMPLNMSGKWFNVVSYGLNAKEEIDYDAMERLAHEKKPKLIIAGASAYALKIDFERFAKVAKAVGAIFMVDMAHYAGLIAAGVYPNPVPHADVVTSTTHKSLRGPRGGIILMKAEHEKAINSAVFPGLQGGPLMHVIAAKAIAFKEALEPSFKVYQQQVIKNAQIVAETLVQRGLRIVSGRTESHVMLVDLRNKNITGKEAEAILGDAYMTINKNGIPNDPEKPMVTSGVRIGTPAMTTRGFGGDEARATANLIADVLDNPHDAANIEAVRAKVVALTSRFPVYG
jgi:glycine hydroxymethyltransferase